MKYVTRPILEKDKYPQDKFQFPDDIRWWISAENIWAQRSCRHPILAVPDLINLEILSKEFESK